MCALGVASLLAAACGGTDFSAADPDAGSAASAGEDEPGGSGSGAQGGSGARGGSTAGGRGGTTGTGGSTAGNAGSGGGSMTLCSSAVECDDQNPCSLDVCNSEGVCEHPAKCDGAEPRCCGGVCGQCCVNEDCPPVGTCMEPMCVSGFCTNVPGPCQEGEYCTVTGCVPEMSCTDSSECEDDGNPCTEEVCFESACEHNFCDESSKCCPDGCAQCCSDSQCREADGDPCKVNRCDAGTCTTPDLCSPGQLCCPNAEGTSATCGECCDSNDCADDGVLCTVEVCRSGVCKHEPDSALCDVNQICDVSEGCLDAGGCTGPDQCPAPAVCEQVECRDGECRYQGVSCSNGEECCTSGPLQGHCSSCCSNTDCITGGDTTAVNCCQDDGQCHECCSNFDCPQGVVANIASGGAIGIPQTCRVCNQQTRTCVSKSTACPSGEICCADGSCSTGGGLCLATE